jgi:hypothetical protein
MAASWSVLSILKSVSMTGSLGLICVVGGRLAAPWSPPSWKHLLEWVGQHILYPTSRGNGWLTVFPAIGVVLLDSSIRHELVIAELVKMQLLENEQMLGYVAQHV